VRQAGITYTRQPAPSHSNLERARAPEAFFCAFHLYIVKITQTLLVAEHSFRKWAENLQQLAFEDPVTVGGALIVGAPGSSNATNEFSRMMKDRLDQFQRSRTVLTFAVTDWLVTRALLRSNPVFSGFWPALGPRHGFPSSSARQMYGPPQFRDVSVSTMARTVYHLNESPPVIPWTSLQEEDMDYGGSNQPQLHRSIFNGSDLSFDYRSILWARQSDSPVVSVLVEFAGTPDGDLLQQRVLINHRINEPWSSTGEATRPPPHIVYPKDFCVKQVISLWVPHSLPTEAVMKVLFATTPPFAAVNIEDVKDDDVYYF
jgi:hypothetical protein